MTTEDVSLEHAPPADLYRDEKVEQKIQPPKRWQYIALGLIALLTAFLNFFQLQNNGYANTYYTAAVKSMSQSWHNFFFVSFDPGGFVTIDKPPLGLWLQTISVKIFGFSGFSVMLPQALAGLCSVILLYHLVRRYFGTNAGLLAALLLAITPISVAINRDNNLDPILVLLLLLATWFVMLAVDTGKLRWLLLCALMVGLGFNVKTLQAFLVVPAFGLLYLLGSSHGWWKRIWHVLVAVVLLLVVSFAWLVAVDLTPASQRPYVGSSQTNSYIELTFGYNGVSRLLGMGNTGGLTRNNADRTSNTNATNNAGGMGGGMGMMEGGPAGPMRLLNPQLGGQISWLLPMAIIGIFALVWQRRPRFPLSHAEQNAILWGISLLIMIAFFSVASFFHTYYLVMLAPSVSALAAIGALLTWRDYRTLQKNNWRAWVLPVALIVTAAEQVYILTAYDPWKNVLIPLVLVLTLGTTIALVIAKLKGNEEVKATRNVQKPAFAGALATLMLTPMIWSAFTMVMPLNAILPTAGPMLTRGGSGFPGGMPAGGMPAGGFPGGMPAGGMPAGGNSGQNGAQPGGMSMMGAMMGQSNVDAKLVQYLQSNQGNTKYLLAVNSAMSAAPFIIQTGEPVMAMGGFLGSDPILNQEKLVEMVHNGTVRFFMLQSGNIEDFFKDLPADQRKEIEEMIGGMGGMGPMGGNSETNSWIQNNCKVVSTSEWQTESSTQNTTMGGRGGMGEQLYDCANAG